ncbi:MAG: hypothetical protein ABS45_16965 [Comamonas sp. SCN 65-56]|jgi:hypothetical protein|uniref:hypothetical protein n=1 Tax=Comamonas sp. SCN 65-56 TaxID=1660095 RepID=UPI00086E46D9|nr:hypothetical protein [Comamonas sp. SCN 65-56]KAB2322302.1 hypothetical protein F8A86_03380 [Betaproteobacteria bacterium SCN1]MBN8760479.1 hypothetical protein [Thiobacillus sp.]ODU88176.1 MAG: hypothetical protein ABT21_12370 [Thiobacillus sp. SCN 65-179]OJW36424.1 MAG: hypothetical protein BGO61_01730 [Thiobacillus sp. 65-69]ODS89052.1 MAG: hypothetical protein ABS45_16965 [Comamonas sp. SCN 65-56]
MNKVAMKLPTHIQMLPLLVGIVSCCSVAVVGSYFWREWTIEAGFVSLLYFSGVFRFFPWKTAYAKAFSIGVFIGMLIPLIAFIRSLA